MVSNEYKFSDIVLPVLTTDKLTYFKEKKTFITDASALENRRGVCLAGYTIINPKTKQKRVFNFSTRDISEGEIIGWRYKTGDGLSLLIINT